MASKNMTTIMALYLTFNLVFLGFITAQTPPPPANQPQCPVDLVDLKVCLNVFTNIVNPQDPANILNPQDKAQCCTLLTKLGGPIAALCSCELARTRVPGVANASITTAQAFQFLKVCPGVTAPPNFRCN
ncbi:unnamed protein product [Eruca vesicaria subsp. sativa]|uniref:Hydrophobic seed protein domain-containing protein n=1 Tax=Eruca vesicaria subsp. sativa TaxID=29727 RepID=A0ABC8L352_ERUVS|nr:unnamed protein product [Eruca vesicaria subsp. sativa]